MKTKIESHITVDRLRAHYQEPPFFFKIDAGPTDETRFTKNYEWRAKVVIHALMMAPEDAKEEVLPEVVKYLNQEVYGDIKRELVRLLALLMQEKYRKADDPVWLKMQKLIEMCG